MNLKFQDYFVPYKYGIFDQLKEMVSILSIKEMANLAMEYAKFTSNPASSLKTSMRDMLSSHKFTQQSIIFIDRICKLTDGAGINKYTVYEFMQLINQNAFYSIYQPNKPTDRGLFRDIQHKLMNLGVKFCLGQKVTKIIDKNNTQYATVTTTNKSIKAHNVIVATPMSSLSKILSSSSKPIRDNFGPIELVNQYIKQT